MKDKALILISDLAKLGDLLLDQMELDTELIDEFGYCDYKNFGDKNNLIPYFDFINKRDDLMNTLQITTVNRLSDDGIESRVYDINGSRPLTHLQLFDRIHKVITA